ncbi:MAG: hypothetical protein B7Z35_10390 [Hydrogenophilales bacterium 12-61-10]|nr:MAG: hypothetical protein B7Z35_10390 [Hydrogenophilales bacterium 12-61-10]OYX27037.1 MAG: hypothetical protein B7Z03_14155 [Hydrogenophilales bacterium 32-62-9]
MSKKTLIAAAAGTAFAAVLAAPVATAAGNPFALSALSSGYQVADNHPAKPMEGKCGAEKAKDGKCGEGKCGAKMKAHDGKCGADKATDGKCGAAKSKAPEAKCGAAK